MAPTKTTSKKETTKKTVPAKSTGKKAAITKTAKKKIGIGEAAAAAKKSSRVSAKETPVSEKQTKLQIVQAIAEDAGVERKQVEAVFGSLAGLIRGHMQKRGSGEFTVPEIGVKIVRARKPATKARKGRNPATGEEITIPAKPAHDVVRLSALKVLKDTVA